MTEKIVKFPCSVGDKLYILVPIWHLIDESAWTYYYEIDILEAEIVDISYNLNKKKQEIFTFGLMRGKYEKADKNVSYSTGYIKIHKEQFGVDYFFTRQEAEERLRLLAGENNFASSHDAMCRLEALAEQFKN